MGAERDRIVDEAGVKEMATFLDTEHIMLPTVPHEVGWCCTGDGWRAGDLVGSDEATPRPVLLLTQRCHCVLKASLKTFFSCPNPLEQGNRFEHGSTARKTCVTDISSPQSALLKVIWAVTSFAGRARYHVIVSIFTKEEIDRNQQHPRC